jgi:YggT family protein
LLFLSYIRQISPPLPLLLLASGLELVLLSLQMFVFAIFIYIILSWFSPGTYNPLTAMLRYVVEPVLSPFRRIIPLIGGIDISPIFAIICLQAMTIFLESLHPLH